MTIPVLDEKQLIEHLNLRQNPFFVDYYAFYSSWFGGIVKDPHFMLVPIDDHMVHRGDGVFEGIKVVGRSIYLLDEHLKRLYASAEKIALKPQLTLDELREIVLATVKAANKSEVMIRLFLSRGPGNFTVNPYDSAESQLYVVIHRLAHPAAEKYSNGVTIGRSHVHLKPSWMAQAKTCNYLPNVLMKKEAVDRKLDFVIGVDDQNSITESATENIMIVDEDGVIVHPKLDYILKGITMIRACELAREHGFSIKVKPITLNDLQKAREAMITGTTLDVLPVVKFENDIIGDGKPGLVAKKLHELILNDIKTGTNGTRF